MQMPLTATEKEQLQFLTTGYGRAAWVEREADIKPDMRRKLTSQGRADEEIVKKVRSFLKTKEAKALIARMRETESVS